MDQTDKTQGCFKFERHWLKNLNLGSRLKVWHARFLSPILALYFFPLTSLQSVLKDFIVADQQKYTLWLTGPLKVAVNLKNPEGKLEFISFIPFPRVEYSSGPNFSQFFLCDQKRAKLIVQGTAVTKIELLSHLAICVTQKDEQKEQKE